MVEPLLILALGAVVLAALYGVGRWAARLENRAQERRVLDRVYYPKRGRKAGLQVLLRRQGQPQRKDRAPPDDYLG